MGQIAHRRLLRHWSVIEFVNREFFWGTVVGGVAVYAAYELLLKFKPASEENAGGKADAAGTIQTSQWKAHPRIETTPAEASFPCKTATCLY